MPLKQGLQLKALHRQQEKCFTKKELLFKENKKQCQSSLFEENHFCFAYHVYQTERWEGIACIKLDCGIRLGVKCLQKLSLIHPDRHPSLLKPMLVSSLWSKWEWYCKCSSANLCWSICFAAHWKMLHWHQSHQGYGQPQPSVGVMVSFLKSALLCVQIIRLLTQI